MLTKKVNFNVVKNLGDLCTSCPRNSIREHIHILLYILFTIWIEKF